MQGAEVPSLVGELGSLMPRGAAKANKQTNKNNRRLLMLSINPFLNFSSFILETSIFYGEETSI